MIPHAGQPAGDVRLGESTEQEPAGQHDDREVVIGRADEAQHRACDAADDAADRVDLDLAGPGLAAEIQVEGSLDAVLADAEAGQLEQGIAGSAKLEAIDGVSSVSCEARDDWYRFTCECGGGVDVRETVYRTAAEKGWPLRELTARRGNLEDVFVALTKEEEA